MPFIAAHATSTKKAARHGSRIIVYPNVCAASNHAVSNRHASRISVLGLIINIVQASSLCALTGEDHLQRLKHDLYVKPH